MSNEFYYKKYVKYKSKYLNLQKYNKTFYDEYHQIHVDDINKVTKIEIKNENDNIYTDIKADYFDRYTELEELVIKGTHIKQLPKNIFNNLKKLKTHKIVNNQITKLPEKIFDNLEKLEKLEIFEPIKKLPIDIFSNLSMLKELDISVNSIKTPGNRVSGLSKLNLEKLYLSINVYLTKNTKTFPKNIFQDLKNIKELTIIGYGISSLPKNIFLTLNTLEKLIIKNTSIQKFPETIFNNLMKLKELEIVDEDMADTYNVKHLPENIFNKLINLTSLVLIYRPSGKLSPKSTIFNGLQNLKLLHLTTDSKVQCPLNGDKVKMIIENKIFNELKNLKVLNLTNTRLAANNAEMLFRNLTSLEEIVLDYTNIEYDSLRKNCFKNSVNLKYIKYINSTFMNLPDRNVSNPQIPEYKDLVSQEMWNKKEGDKGVHHQNYKFDGNEAAKIEEIRGTGKVLVYIYTPKYVSDYYDRIWGKLIVW